jgi:hypothetical protein
MANDLSVMRRIMEQLAAKQEQMAQDIATLQAAEQRNVCQLGLQKLFDHPHFCSAICSRFIIRVRQRIGKKLMTRITHAAQIDLRFGDLPCENFDVSAGVPPCDLTRQGLHFFTKRLVRLDGKAQTVVERFFCRQSSAGRRAQCFADCIA